MMRREELQRSQMELYGLVEIGHDALLLESVSKASSKIVQKQGSIRMTQGEKLQRSPMELDGLIKVRHDATLQEFVSKGERKIVQRQRSI
jgi:hypothetical protein